MKMMVKRRRILDIILIRLMMGRDQELGQDNDLRADGVIDDDGTIDNDYSVFLMCVAFITQYVPGMNDLLVRTLKQEGSSMGVDTNN